MVVVHRVQRLAEADEVTGDEPRTLVDELVEGVLTVGPRLAPVDWGGVVVHLHTVKGDVLTVALHRELLQVGRKPFEILVVGENCDGLRAKKVAVPDGK